MGTCDEMLDLLSLRLDADLTPEQEAALAEHLAACPDCGALAGDLARLHAVMPTLNETPPASIMEHVMARIKADTPAPIPFPVKKTNPNRWRAWGGIAAALVLVAAGAFAIRGGDASTRGEGAPMTLDAGVAGAIPADAPRLTPEPTLVPKVAAEPQEPAVFTPPSPPSEEVLPADSTPTTPPTISGSGSETTVDNGENSPAVEPPAVRSAVLPMPEPTAAVPPATMQPFQMEPAPNIAPMLGGLPTASPTPPPVSHLTTTGAAIKLYEAHFAQQYPDFDTENIAVGSDGSVACTFPDGTLAYVETTEDGTAYLFRYTAHSGETADYLVPADGSEIAPMEIQGDSE